MIIFIAINFGLLGCISAPENSRRVENGVQVSSNVQSDEDRGDLEDDLIVTGSRISRSNLETPPIRVSSFEFWPELDLEKIESWSGRTIRWRADNSTNNPKDIRVIRDAVRKFQLCRSRDEKREFAIDAVSKRCPSRGKGQLYRGAIFSTDDERAIVVWNETNFRTPSKKRATFSIHGPCYITHIYAVYDTKNQTPVLLSTGRQTIGPLCLS